jgi:hypothetical protein
MASAAPAASAAWWAVVGAALTPVRVPGRGGAVLAPVLVQALAASWWPPLVLVPVLVALLSKRPRVPARTPSHEQPRGLALQRAGVMPRALVLPLAFAPTLALVLQGPY